MQKIALFLLSVTYYLNVSAQQINAVNGSAYVPIITQQLNPATIANTDRKFSLQLLGSEFNFLSNSFYFKDYNILKKIPDTITLVTKEAKYAPIAKLNGSFNIFSLAIKGKRNSAFSLGSSIRNSSSFKSEPINWNDTIGSVTDFFRTNVATDRLHGNMLTSTWVENSIGFATEISINNNGTWYVGVKMKHMLGLTGGYFSLQNVHYTTKQTPAITYNQLIDGKGIYAFSSNTDALLNEKLSNTDKGKEFLKNSKSSFGFDIGAEYVQHNNFWGDEAARTNYNFKIGIAIVDIGNVQYGFSKNSLSFNGFNNNAFDTSLQRIINNATTVEKFKDSLTAIVNNANTPSGNFAIALPTRLVISIDKTIAENVYIQACLQMPLTTPTVQNLHTRQLNLLSITPRWEKQRLGAYLPIQVNNNGTTWVGLTGRVGPLIFGFHNIGWLFGKNSVNGGGFLTFIIQGKNRETDNSMPCPRL